MIRVFSNSGAEDEVGLHDMSCWNGWVLDTEYLPYVGAGVGPCIYASFHAYVTCNHSDALHRAGYTEMHLTHEHVRSAYERMAEAASSKTGSDHRPVSEPSETAVLREVLERAVVSG